MLDTFLNFDYYYKTKGYYYRSVTTTKRNYDSRNSYNYQGLRSVRELQWGQIVTSFEKL